MGFKRIRLSSFSLNKYKNMRWLRYIYISLFFSYWHTLDSFYMPDFGIAILTSGDHSIIVQPHEARNLRLWMSIYIEENNVILKSVKKLNITHS